MIDEERCGSGLEVVHNNRANLNAVRYSIKRKKGGGKQNAKLRFAY